MHPRLAVLLPLLILPTPAAADALPRLALDPLATTVSGLSSGAYMAGQMHVAHSRTIAGAALIAGGPYGCAGDRMLTAVSACMDPGADGPEVAPLLHAAEARAAAGDIDPLAGLAGDRVYLFSGTEDATVTRPVTAAARDFYLAAGVAAPDIRFRDDVAAGHGFPALGAPNACAASVPPFLNDCGIDLAGDLLAWLLGPLPGPVPPAEDGLIGFSQRPFLADPGNHALAETGYVYVPDACRSGAVCRLHIAFHGCRQGIGEIGDRFARTSGYIGWAEAAGLVVLFPQADASVAELNPNGCWDWWGYDDPDHATRHGPQVLAVARMAERLGVDLNGPTPVCVSHDAWNWQHLAEGRATVCGLFDLCAGGSGDPIGPYFGASVLLERRDGSFATGACGP